MTVPESMRVLTSALDHENDAFSAARPARGGREAAVLALFAADGPMPDITVTERSHTMRKHPGQISFPGGSVDPTDASPEAAALREAEEEIGLDTGSVRLLGRLPAVHVAVSGFDVTTVVGWWERPHAVRPIDVAEVAGVHRIGVDELADPAIRRTCMHPSGYAGPAFLVHDLFVWGLTAHLIDGLLRLGGWWRKWDTSRQAAIPDRYLSDRARRERRTGPDTH